MKNLAYLFLFISLNVYSNCQEHNLLETNARLHEMSIRNQGSFSTCYAHALSAYHETMTGTALHPYSIAYEHKKRILHWTPRNLNYSLASYAWKDVRKKGACSSQEVTDRLNYFRVNQEYNDDQLIYAIKTILKYKKNQNRAIEKLMQDPFKDGIEWTNRDLEALYSKLSPYFHRKFFSFLKHEVFKDCTKIYPEERVKTKGLGFTSAATMANIYESQLEKNNPVVLGYCSKRVENENYSPKKPRSLMALSSKCGAHYALIVGQKEINNKCHILIKNSHSDHFWGTHHCLCLDETGKQIVCNKEEAKDKTVIGCYFPKKELIGETFDLTYHE